MPTDMVAWYRLKTSSITVNLAQMKWVLLTATEEDHCTYSLQHYCDVRSAVYAMTCIKLHTVVLFMKDMEKEGIVIRL